MLDPSLTPAGRTGRSAARIGAAAWAITLTAVVLIVLGRVLADPILREGCTGAGRVLLGLSTAIAVWGLMIAANAATLVIPGTPPDPGRIWVHAGLGISGTPLAVVVGYVVWVSLQVPKY